MGIRTSATEYLYRDLGNVLQRVGKLRYVAPSGSDSNLGTDPNLPLKTIVAAIAASSEGDGINVAIGDYDEDGIDFSKNGLIIWFDVGAVITNTTPGTAVVVSGDYIHFIGPLTINPAVDQVGLQVTGNGCHVHNVNIIGNLCSDCFAISGDVNDILDCKGAGAKASTSIFNITGEKTVLRNCGAAGITTSYGYHINGGSTYGILDNCFSLNNGASGYCLCSGVSNWVVKGCTSGEGDGCWLDEDAANVWANFVFADHIRKITTFSGAPTTYNIFKITGTVLIDEVCGEVGTQIANTASTAHLELYSAGGTVDLTKEVGGPDLDSLPTKSFIVKTGDAAEPLSAVTSSTPGLIEFGSKSPRVPFECVEDSANATYIRLNLTAALASGAIQWHCRYTPLSSDGFVEPA